MRLRLALSGTMLFLGGVCAAQTGTSRDTLRVDYSDAKCRNCRVWNAPQQPFRVFGNTYYVGTHGLSSILITSPGGHVLIDGALPTSAPIIAGHIRALGFKVEDIELIVNSHAHFDHAGGIAALQRMSHARVAAMPWSAQTLMHGESDAQDPQFGIGNPFPPVAGLQVIRDGETLHVGRQQILRLTQGDRSIAVTAHATPGHTPGGTSWSWTSCEGKRCLHMLYVDSQTPVSADSFYFTHSSAYPNAEADFARGLATLERLPCDILITPHPDASSLFERVAARDRGNDSSLVNAALCKQFIADARTAVGARMARERSATLRYEIDSLVADIRHPAAMIVRDIRTDSIIGFASAGASKEDSAALTTQTPIRPLSVVKLLTAAIWVNHFGASGAFTCRGEAQGGESIADIIANGCDGAGKDLAIQLRRHIGTHSVLADLEALGFRPTLPEAADDSSWGAALSIGEADFQTTLLDISKFLEIIGSDGALRGTRILAPRAATVIQDAMRRCVREGTARGIRDALAGTAWTIGGKTGTGPGVDRPNSGGLFAALVFDQMDSPRYAIVVLTKGAGPGGGVAARTAAETARWLHELDSTRSHLRGL